MTSGRTVAILRLLLAVAGLAFATYSVWHQVTVDTLGFSGAVCNVTATLNCDTVALSRYAKPFGIPLGVWGIPYFFVMAVCATFGPRRAWAYEALAAAGLVVTVALAGISAVLVGSLCPTCLAIYAVCIGQATRRYAPR